MFVMEKVFKNLTMTTELPVELQQYILDFVRPFVTRSDWRQCRRMESNGIKQLAKLFTKGHVLENGSWKVDKTTVFYDRLLYGRVIRKEERDALFPLKHLRITIWSLV